jgi:hypothetical protein
MHELEDLPLEVQPDPDFTKMVKMYAKKDEQMECFYPKNILDTIIKPTRDHVLNSKENGEKADAIEEKE